MNRASQNPGSQIGGILWNVGTWIRRRPWAASAAGATLSALITVFGFGKDPRNGLVYVSEPILEKFESIMTRIVKESEDRQNAKLEGVVELLQEFKDYDSAQSRLDARRAEDERRAKRRDKLLSPTVQMGGFKTRTEMDPVEVPPVAGPNWRKPGGY